jgi:TP901 family phage tail tape measure protein
MDNTLKLRVMFDMIDNMTKPLKNILVGSKGLAESLKKTRRELSEMKKTQKSVGEFREMREGLATSASKLNAAREQVTKLAGSLRAAGPPSRQMIAEFEKAKQAASRLSAEHKKQSVRVSALREQLMGAGINTRNLAQHERELRTSISATIGVMTTQQNKLADLTLRTKRLAEARERMDKTRTLAGSMTSTGAKMMAGRATVGAVTLGPIAAYAKAEDSATQLASALMRAGGVVPPEFEKINGLAMKLGDRLPGTTSDFQDMMTMLTRQGISAQAILGGMGEATAYLGVQLKKTPAEAAEFTAKLQDATRTAERDMLALTDVIQKSFMLGVDDNNMLSGFTKLGPAMDTILMKGLEGAKALAPLLVMSDQSGMEGSSAGNAYRKVFQLSMDAKKVAKANKQLASAQRLDFTNGKGEFGGLDKMFAQFEKLKGLSTQKRLAVMKEIFGDDAETLQVISLMIEKGKTGYDEVRAKMAAQASMQERVNKQLGTLKNLWEAASGTFTNGLVAFGEAIAPEVKGLVEWLGSTAERMSSWARENPRLANGMMKVAAIPAITMAVMGSFLVVLAGLLGPLALVRFSLTTLGMQGGILTRVLGAGTSAFLKLSGSAFGFASAGKFVQSTAARVRTVLAAAWQASSPSAAWSSLRAYAKSLGQRIPAACKAAKAAVRQWGVSAATAFKDGIKAAKQYTVQLWRAVAAQLAAARAAAASRWTMARQYVARRGISGMAIDTARGGFNLIKGGAKGTINGVASALGGLAQTLLFVGRVALTSPIGIVITIIALAALALIRYWRPVKAWFSGVWQGLTEGLKPLAPIFAALGTVFAPLKPMFNWLMDAVKGVWNWIKRLLGPVDASKESLDSATQAGKGFGAWLADIIVVIAGIAARSVELGANLISGLVNGIKSGLGLVKDTITNVADSTVTWFKEKLGIHSPSRVFSVLGGFVSQGAAIGMEDEQGRVARAAAALATVATVSFGSPALAAGAQLAQAARTAAVPLVRPSVPIDRRAPLTASPAPANVTTAASPITIHIHPPAGSDAAEIGRMVRAELERAKRAEQSRQGSRLSD